MAALAAGALIAGNAPLFAQNTNPPPPASEHGHGMRGHQDLVKTLNLTDEQKPKFQEIMKNSMQQRKGLREDASLSSEDRRTKMQAIKRETDQKLKDLLTPEQFAKYQEATAWPRKGPAKGAAPEN